MAHAANNIAALGANPPAWGALHACREASGFLETQNPWWTGSCATPAERFRRSAFGEAIHRTENGLAPIVAIRGPRQVGKTTIQQQVIEELLKLRGINPARILRVQFDEVPTLGSYRQQIIPLVQWYEKHVLRESINALAAKKQPVYLFFDEVQNLRTWAPQIKSLVDSLSAKTFVTGSSALRIASGRDSLAGRISMIELGPLRLAEIVGVRQLGELPAFHEGAAVDSWKDKEFWLDLGVYAAKHGKILRRAFEAFSEVGGYPVCHKGRAERAELVDLINSTVVRRTLGHDLHAGSGGRTRDRTVLEETFRRVCRYAGQGVRSRRIAEELSQLLASDVGEKSVRDSVAFLANALLVQEIHPLEALNKRQTHPAKVCLCDHFVREAWLQERIPISPAHLAGAPESVATTAGHLVESDIGYYLKGIPGADVSWFPERNGEPEVDFVVTVGLQRIPIEVKYRRSRPGPSDVKGLKSFCAQAKYNAPFGLLITQGIAGELARDVVALPAYALLSVR